MAQDKRDLHFMVNIQREYGTTQMVADVGFHNERGELLNLSSAFRWDQGFELKHLRVHMYLSSDTGNDSPFGLRHTINAHALELEELEAAVKMMRKLDKRMTVLNSERGYVGSDFSTYLQRIAEILGINRFYSVRNSDQVRARSGEYFRRADGAGLQSWVRDHVREAYPNYVQS